ncbi:MAG: tetratricopeptide repeat protein [Gemmataceae bacterium]
MSTTLNFVDHLLARGRQLQELGREHDAIQILKRLNAFRDLTPETCEETLARLAQMLLHSGRFLKARKHLKALLVQCPDNAEYQRMMAEALDGDERAEPVQAANHYRRSLELDPEQPDTRCTLGLLLLRLGQAEEGLQQLRQAAQQEPDNPEIIAQLVEGLRQEGGVEEARRVLREARFRNPRHAAFAKLWSDFHFQLIREKQEAAKVGPNASERPNPWVLPFESALGGKRIRRDAAEQPQPPHTPDDVPARKAL